MGGIYIIAPQSILVVTNQVIVNFTLIALIRIGFGLVVQPCKKNLARRETPVPVQMLTAEGPLRYFPSEARGHKGQGLNKKIIRLFELGILRDLQAFSWLRVFSAPKQIQRPALTGNACRWAAVLHGR